MSTRISTNQLYHNSQRGVAQARESEVRSSERASTQKEINRPSDNPTGWTQVAGMKEDLKTSDTIVKNLAGASRVFSVTDNVLAQISEGLQRAHELAITASSESIPKEEGRDLLLKDVRGVFDQLQRALNLRYNGKTVFGGYETLRPAYDADGTRLGDENIQQIEIGNGMKIDVSFPTSEVFHGKGSREGVDIIDVMRGLISGLDNNNLEQIRASLPELMRGIDQISMGRAVVGARMNEIDRITEGQANEKIARQDAISKVEEVDALKAFSDLSRDQTVLRSAISTAEKLLADDPVNILFR